MTIVRVGALLFALTLPMPAVAQATAPSSADAPAQVDPARIYGNMIRTAERDVVSLAEAMPDEKYSFAPAAGLFAVGQSTDFKGVRTFVQQVAHVASSNYEYLQVMGFEKDKDYAAIEKLTTKAQALQALKDSFAAAEKAAAIITPQNAFEGLGPQKTRTRAALAAAIAWHTMDHYGQMVVYARMNGVVPPQSR
jgi:uncharacterized damage-inducible protein DinB